MSGDDREPTTDEVTEARAFHDRMRADGRMFYFDEFGRPAGRPKGIRDITKAGFLAAYRKLRSELDRTPKQRELAARLHAGPRQVRQWLTDFGLPWPPE